MTADLKPLAVIDCHDRDEWARITSTPGLLARLQDWACSNDIDPVDTYRIEVYPGDCLFGRVFQYDRDERGNGYCPLNHRHIVEECEIAKRVPFDVPLGSLPPVP
ncbi:hypothetical protein [Microbispora sp. ATCC PTA-5024]|uniref:hypothetical protein n=1 Tax=Microbispora sp. ATCC PTA-5024 TaxID=316330 RepID=UPI0003DB8ACC|nr:hypothetical protein [Microbispora sp. ATCC PTA-5024]ETK36152.1 hypothetical protein MPTA5024_11035 [Microbispora sp. ATCC PTA-5024]